MLGSCETSVEMGKLGPKYASYYIVDSPPIPWEQMVS